MIIEYIQEQWLEWVLSLISIILTALYRNVSKRLKDEQKRSAAIAEGVQSLLRESIVQNYNKYHDKEYCPIYAKESIKRVYQAYHKLGGNDVATKLYEKILEMPEEKEEHHEF